MTWWRRKDDPRSGAEIDVDTEFARTRRKMLSLLGELVDEVERIEHREAARERLDRRRQGPQPGTV
jgi:hypothetical protein